MAGRSDKVRRTVESVAGICGLSAARVCVSGSVKTGCRITQEGVDLLVNHEWNEDVASRRRYGVSGRITLAETDLMVACFVASRAHDFFLEDWHQHACYGSDLSQQAQRYLQASVDDMAAYARMIRRIPFAAARFEAYLSRAAAHALSSEPLHLQLVRALLLYLFEDRPQVVVAPTILEELGTTADMSPLVSRLKRIVFDGGLSYTKRHAQAAALLVGPFARMLKMDEAALSFYDLMHLYDEEPLYGASKDAAADENVLRQEAELASRTLSSFESVNADNIDQLIADNNEPLAPDAGTPNLGLPGLPAETGTMRHEDGGGDAYEEAVLRWHGTIDDIAEVLVRIATPQEQLSVPRYGSRVCRTGSRMHPGFIVNAQMQLASGQERPIWQRAARKARPQDMRFQGLDIFLLLDVSTSMTGDNARHAAAMAACLVEGIDLAVETASRDQRRSEVDIRTQLLAFGEGWAELTPLEERHEQDRKRFAFAQLQNPSSDQTLVTAALRRVQEHAAANASRDVLCLMVGDGLFADGLQARKCAMSLPENAYLAHINIGEYAGLPLTSHFETIQDPALLPEKLRAILSLQLGE